MFLSNISDAQKLRGSISGFHPASPTHRATGRCELALTPPLHRGPAHKSRPRPRASSLTHWIAGRRRQRTAYLRLLASLAPLREAPPPGGGVFPVCLLDAEMLLAAHFFSPSAFLSPPPYAPPIYATPSHRPLPTRGPAPVRCAAGRRRRGTSG